MYFHVTGIIPDPSKLAPYIEAEKQMSLQLQKEGSTIFAFRRTDHPGVFLLIEADDLGQAKTNMGRLPFVAEGVMTVEYVEVTKA